MYERCGTHGLDERKKMNPIPHNDRHVSHCTKCNKAVWFNTPRGVSAVTMIKVWLTGEAKGLCRECWTKQKLATAGKP